jgi:hypothetical protein
MRSFCLETKRTKKFKAVAALPKTGFHFAGLAKLALWVVGRLCIWFAQTVASLNLVRRSRHIGVGFIPAGFLTANRLMPGYRQPKAWSFGFEQRLSTRTLRQPKAWSLRYKRSLLSVLGVFAVEIY